MQKLLLKKALHSGVRNVLEENSDYDFNIHIVW
jgi:hypothetical protein